MSVDRIRPSGDNTANVRAMTTTERNALTSTPSGRTIFNTTTSQFERYTGSAWVVAAVRSADNTVTNVISLTQAAYDALGTKDANTLYVIVG